MARNSFLCADVPLRNYSLTHPMKILTISPMEVQVELARPQLYMSMSPLWNRVSYKTEECCMS